jgi:long-chain acyl-CoA synthetase
MTDSALKMPRMHTPWIDRYDPGVPASCTYPDWTVTDLLRRSAARFPDRPAILFYGARITYRQLDELTSRFAAALQRLGVRPGDRVGLMLPNVPQMLIGYYGALKAGAIVMPTNPLYVSRELETQLVDSGAETLVALDLFYPRIAPILAQSPLKRLILTSIGDYLPAIRRLLYPVKARLNGRWISVRKTPPLYDFVELIKHANGHVGPDPTTPAAQSPDDVSLLQYTGGTTGTPKGVMLSHRNVVVNASQCRAWVPDFMEGQEVFLGVIPFFHVYGLSTCQHLAIMTGSALVLLPRFEVDEVLRAIHTHQVTVFSGIPAMFMKISDHPKVGRYDLSSLRVCLSGASPLHAEVRNRFELLTGVKISEGYGLTEAGPVTHCNPVYGDRPHGSIGLPFPDTEVRIVDPISGDPAALGQPGELAVRGPQVMQGYWQKTEETRAVLRDGWLYTGDMVQQDGSGFFFLVDRKKDMIKSRGENVYPREVEEVLFRHPAVQDAVVVGIPDRLLGEAVKAYIVLRDQHAVTQQELMTHCRASLASYKVPTSVAFRPELPRTLVGKVLRRALREQEMAEQTLADNGQAAQSSPEQLSEPINRQLRQAVPEMVQKVG